MTGIISPLDSAAAASVSTPLDPDPATPEHMEAIRSLVLRAHPEIVPELLHGDSIETLLASVEPAKAAYARIAAALPPVSPSPAPAVPAGGSPPVTVDFDRLPASEKIRRGIANRRQN
jgi:hypothetical protein